MTEVLEHIPREQKRQSVSEIYRVLKANSVLVFSVPHKGLFTLLDYANFGRNFPRLHKLKHCIFGQRNNHDDIDAGIKHRHYSLEEIKVLFNKMFYIQEVHCNSFLLYPLSCIFERVASYTRLHSKPIFRALRNLDYSLRFGRLAYNMIVLAIKKGC